ncbi:MAG: cell wall hydrolase [Novosphingobium sp.]
MTPVTLVKVTPDSARRINAAVPFLAGAVAAARPFVFAGSPADRERATTCLASAAWYEAGDDAVGERAVVQVVLNRLRHPAFPKTVCGVVFQGAERQTGCQFTFACDGAMARTPSAVAWGRARTIAVRALAGGVDKTVGTATHYHTDWVVPYWSGSLDKIAAVDTHLFFRWRGWWGRPAAFFGRYAGGETMDSRLLHLAGAEAQPDMVTAGAAMANAALPPAAGDGPALAAAAVAYREMKGNAVRVANPAGTEFGLALDPHAYPGSYAIFAYSLCKTKPACVVQGWIDPRHVPAVLGPPERSLYALSFLYRKDARRGGEEFQWNCRQIARENKAQCLPGTGGAIAARD